MLEESSILALFLEFGFLLFFLGLLTKYASKIGISPVPFYMISGLMFSSEGLLPIDKSSGLVELVAKMGSISLLLLLGLEYSGPELINTAKRQPINGILDFLLNFTPGLLLGLLLNFELVYSIALAGVTYVSSSGIATQIIRDMKWKKNPENTSLVGLLIIEDLIMAPFLPILASLILGVSFVGGLVSLGVALSILAVVLWVSNQDKVKTIKWFAKNDDTSGLILIVFGAALIAAGASFKLNFSPEVSAFLVGLLLTGEIAEKARKRLDPLREVLAAVFFAYFGLSAHLSTFTNVILPAFILALVSIVTKLITGWFVGSVEGLGFGSRIRAGALLSARGEFSVVIATLLLSVPNINKEIPTLIITYLIITAIFAPILARFADKIGLFLFERIKK